MNKIIKYIRFYFDKFFNKPEYILEGSCKKCGRCCRNIVLYAYDIPITNEEVFKDFQKNNKRMRFFYPTGKNENGEILFTCKMLRDNNTCKIHFFRSLYCRNYPLVKSFSKETYLPPPEYCGYRIEPKKRFKDFL